MSYESQNKSSQDSQDSQGSQGYFDADDGLGLSKSDSFSDNNEQQHKKFKSSQDSQDSQGYFDANDGEHIMDSQDSQGYFDANDGEHIIDAGSIPTDLYNNDNNLIGYYVLSDEPLNSNDSEKWQNTFVYNKNGKYVGVLNAVNNPTILTGISGKKYKIFMHDAASGYHEAAFNSHDAVSGYTFDFNNNTTLNNECEQLKPEIFMVWNSFPPDEYIDYYAGTGNKYEMLKLTSFQASSTKILYFFTIPKCKIDNNVIIIPANNIEVIKNAITAAMRLNNNGIVNVDINDLLFNVIENKDYISTGYKDDKDLNAIEKQNKSPRGKLQETDPKKKLFIKNFLNNKEPFKLLQLVAKVDYINGNQMCNITFYYIHSIKTTSFKAKKISEDKIEYLKHYWLDNNKNFAVKDLVNSTNPPFYSFDLTQNDNSALNANFKVYESGNFIDIQKFNQLLNKPHIYLRHTNLSTYLNLLLSMLDKPHDIIGSRVPCAAQQNCAGIAAQHLHIYIEYLITKVLPVINDDHKKQSITSLINFIRTFYLQKHTSKPKIGEYSYENIILYSVCKFYEEHMKTTKNPCNSWQSLNTLEPLMYDSLHSTINLDLLYITNIQKNAIQQNNKFSGNELIDSAHHTELINTNTPGPGKKSASGKKPASGEQELKPTIIEFPENLKIIQIECEKFILTIHSYTTYEIKTNSPTEPLTVPKKNNKPQTVVTQSNSEMYVVINVWFNIHPIGSEYDKIKQPPNGPLIRYEIPIRNAPGCAQVYQGYHSNLQNLNNLSKYFFDWLQKSGLPNQSSCINFFLVIMMDQLFNAKSCQDDQNQLQVGQIGTNYHIDLDIDNSNNETDIYIGMGGDLLSAANAINYYFALKENGFNINNNSIVGYLKDNNIIWASNNMLCFFILKNSVAAQSIVNIISKKMNSKNFKGGTKHIVQYDGRPDVLYGWLYTKENFNMPLEKLIDLFTPRYKNNNSLSDVYSINFMIQLIQKLNVIKQQKQITEDIIYQTSMEILNGDKIKSDNIDLDENEIIMYNKLNEEYFNIIGKDLKTELTNKNLEETANNNIAMGIKNNTRLALDEYVKPTAAMSAGFSKKRNNKKKTNKKRTNKKRTNKKRISKKKMKRAIFKTKKNN